MSKFQVGDKVRYHYGSYTADGVVESIDTHVVVTFDNWIGEASFNLDGTGIGHAGVKEGSDTGSYLTLVERPEPTMRELADEYEASIARSREIRMKIEAAGWTQNYRTKGSNQTWAKPGKLSGPGNEFKWVKIIPASEEVL